MNFQLQQAMRRSERKLTSKMKIDLFGARPDSVQDLNRIKSIKIARPSIICSKEGMGITIEQDENEYIRKILCKRLADTKKNNLHQKYVIPLDNPIKKTFDVVMILLVVYSVLSSLYFLAFHSMGQKTAAFDIFVWLMFILDFILNFFAEIQDRRGQRIKNLKMISNNYLKSYFFIDLMSLIPIRYAGHPNGEFILRLLRTIKINRFLDLFDKLLIIEFASSLVYDVECLDKKKLRYKLNMLSAMLVQVLKMFFATYFLACLWYYYVDYVLREKNESIDFIKNFNLEVDSKAKRFVKTWYYIFTTLVTVGYGDFYATNKYEMGFAILLVLAGTSWFAFMMGTAIRILQEYDSETGNAVLNTSLSCWFSVIETAHSNIPPLLKERISEHFTNLWKNDRLETIFNDSDECSFVPDRTNNQFFYRLPKLIQEDLLEYLFSDILYSYRIFFNSFGEAKFIICRFLQPRLFNKGEAILFANSPVNEVLFLTQGTVFLTVLKNKYTSKEIRSKKFKFMENSLSTVTLRKNCIIGEYYVLNSKNPQVYYFASTNVKGFAIPAFVLSELKKVMKDEVSSYLEKSQHIYDEIYKFIDESAKLFPQETGDENINKGGASLEITQTGTFSCEGLNHLDSSECLMKKEIEKVSGIIKDFNKDRRLLLNNLKEKIAILAVENMSWKSLIPNRT